MGTTEFGGPIVLVGAGGFSRETADTVRACVAAGDNWDLLGFVDDDPARAGSTIDGLRVLGAIDSVIAMSEARVVVGTGRPDNYTSRRAIVSRLGLPPTRYATIVHPRSSISSMTAVGPGTVVLAGAVSTAAVEIGSHVAIMPGVVLTHDDVIGDYATLASGVRLGGNTHVQPGAYIGSGVLVREGVTVGAWSMIGMGSVVTRDVPAGELWFGSPARYRRAAPVPSELVEESVS